MKSRSAIPTATADADAFRAAREVCRRHATNFYGAAAFLPEGKRDAACAAFAFCRMVRQAVESAGEEVGAARMRQRPLLPSTAAASYEGASEAGGCCSGSGVDKRLSLLRERIDELYAGRLELPAPASRSPEQHVLHAFALAASRYQIPRQHLLDFADGCRQDLSVRRYATWTSLERYCAGTGGAPALIGASVFGLTNSGAAEFAVKAGVAVRFTNVVADLAADVRGGRVYLPLEDLARFRYGERELAAGVVNDHFRELMRFEIARARRLFDEAGRGLCWVAGDGSRLAAATILAWHAGILDAIERRGLDVFAARPTLTNAQKIRRLPIAWRLARRRRDPRASTTTSSHTAAPAPR